MSAPAREGRRASVLGSTLSIGRLTFGQALHERFLHTLFFFSGVLVLLIPLLGGVALGDRVRVVKDVGLGGASLLGLFIAIIWGGRVLAAEVERRSVLSILARPISRNAYLVGRFLGLSVLLAVLLFAMSAVVGLLLWYKHDPVLWLHLMATTLMSWLQLEIISAAALFFSLFLGNWLTLLCAFTVYAGGYLGGDLEDFGRLTKKPIVEWATWGIHQILPRLNLLDYKAAYAYAFHFDPLHYGLAACHGIAYTVALVALAVLIFERKDLR